MTVHERLKSCLVKKENTIYETTIKSARQIRVVGSFNGKTDRLLALNDKQLAKRLVEFRKQQAEAIAAIKLPSL